MIGGSWRVGSGWIVESDCDDSSVPNISDLTDKNIFERTSKLGIASTIRKYTVFLCRMYVSVSHDILGLVMFFETKFEW